MGRAKQQKCSSDSDSSEELSSDDDKYTIGFGRYQGARVADGLRSRQYRLCALLELQEVVVQGYSTASKKVQNCVFEDLIVAVQQLDSRQRVFEATTALVTAAKRALPQQKRNQLLKEQKQAAVAGRRAARRQQGSSGLNAAAMHAESDDDESSPVMLGDVPLEVIRGILQALNPLSLAAAACVCRSWCELAVSDYLWQQHLHLVFPALARQQQQQQQQQQQPSQQPQQERSISAPHAPDSNHSSAPKRLADATAEQLISSNGSIMIPGSQQWSWQQCHHRGAYHRFCQAAQRHPSMLLPWRSCRVLLWGRLQWIPPGDARAPRAAAAARAARRGMLSPGPIYVTHQQAVAWMMGMPWSDVLRNSTSNSTDGDTDSDSDGDSGSTSDGRESHTAHKAFKLWKI